MKGWSGLQNDDCRGFSELFWKFQEPGNKKKQNVKD